MKQKILMSSIITNIVFLLFSCTSNIENKKVNDIAENWIEIKDSIDISNNSEKLIVSFDLVSRSLKDSILKTIRGYENIPPKIKGVYLKDELPQYIKRAMNGDMESYDWVILDLKSYSNLDYIAYSIYVADKYKYSNAYNDILSYFRNKNLKEYEKIKDTVSYEDAKFIRKDYYNLDYITDTERALALFYLLESEKYKIDKSLLQLSYYYRTGKYLPRDTLLSNKLDSIYKIRNY